MNWDAYDPMIAAAANRRPVRIRSTGVQATLVGWPRKLEAKCRVMVGNRHYRIDKTDVELVDYGMSERLCATIGTATEVGPALRKQPDPLAEHTGGARHG